jgi:hypothetical protein
MVTNDGKCLPNEAIARSFSPLHYTTMISFCKFWDKQVTQLFSSLSIAYMIAISVSSLSHCQNVMISIKTPNLVTICCPSIFGNQIS